MQDEGAHTCPHCGGTGLLTNTPPVGPAMRDLRKAHGITMKRVARELAISASYLSDLERGQRTWSQAMAARYEGAIKAIERKRTQ